MLGRIGRSLAACHHRAIHVPRVQRIARVMGELIGHADSLLDVGCGDGSLAAATARAVGASEVCGVDVALRESLPIDAVAYDGRRLPFGDNRFEIVLLSDVLHHAAEPTRVLSESLRVARRAVALKDHLQFGSWSQLVLLVMDHAGNAAAGVPVRGSYLDLPTWLDRIGAAGGVLDRMHWPLRIHDLPWRWITRSEYQFAALIAARGEAAAAARGSTDAEETAHGA